MNFLITRLRACLNPAAHPYERNVCHWLDEVRGAFGVVGTLLGVLPVWGWWDRLHVVAAFYGLTWWPTTLVLVATGAYLAHRAHWMATFVWADFRLEEWGRELLTGNAVNSNMFPTHTKESSACFARGGYPEDAVLEALYHEQKWIVQNAWEKTGQPRYDWQPPDQWTWAQRFHHKHVRPRLIARGVPGYAPWRAHA